MESLCCTPEMKTMLHVNYASVTKKEKKNNNNARTAVATATMAMMLVTGTAVSRDGIDGALGPGSVPDARRPPPRFSLTAALRGEHEYEPRLLGEEDGRLSRTALDRKPEPGRTPCPPSDCRAGPRQACAPRDLSVPCPSPRGLTTSLSSISAPSTGSRLCTSANDGFYCLVGR